MTTHFQANFKNRLPEHVPHCKRFAMRPMWGQMTTDQTKVDCKACAKQLGIAPAAKPEGLHKDGTCQCCFKGQKVSKGQGTLLALHGYSRPGHGYIIGRCRGEAELPFEVSCDRTKFFRAELEAMLKGREAYLTSLYAGEVLEFTEVYEVRARDAEGKRIREGYGWKMETKYHVTKKGDEFVCIEGHCFSYETSLKDKIYKTESTIENIKAHIAFLQEKIDSWVKVW